jgi:hypothetical protein
MNRKYNRWQVPPGEEKPKSNTPEYRKVYKKMKKKSNPSLDIYKTTHQWDKTSYRNTLDIDEIDYYINNDLPLDEYYDNVKLYGYGWKEKGYNLNNEMKKKQQENND